MGIAALVESPAEAAASGPLTSEHRHELALARERTKRIRKAAAVAAFNGWATAGMAMLTAPFALFSLSALVATLVLTGVAFNEFRGRRRLLAFEPSAAALLGWNQIGLLAIVCVYCVWTVYSSLYGANSISTQLQGYAELENALGSLEDIEALCRQLVMALYGSVLALSVVFQGANAVYYFTRRRILEDYVAATPEWIRELQRTMPST